MNIRVKTIFILYNFCKNNNIKLDTDTGSNSIPLPGVAGFDPNGNSQEMPESYSMMNMQMQQSQYLSMSRLLLFSIPKLKNVVLIKRSRLSKMVKKSNISI